MSTPGGAGGEAGGGRAEAGKPCTRGGLDALPKGASVLVEEAGGLKGDLVTVWLNDKLVVDNAKLENYYDRKLSVPEKGPIQLQTHGGEIRWRNVFIKELSK